MTGWSRNSGVVERQPDREDRPPRRGPDGEERKRREEPADTGFARSTRTRKEDERPRDSP